MDIDTRVTDIHEWLKKEYNSIRTGQAAPALLDGIKVENYGSMMPLNQVGSIGVEDARTLRVSTWDASVIPAVEKSIRDADLGVSVATDSAGLRVVFPELTSERRDQLLKLAKSKLEDARVSIRSVRDDVMKTLDTQQKEGEISEDEKFTKREEVQKKIDAANMALEAQFVKKESEIKV